MKRISRACLRCRKHKVKCDLDLLSSLGGSQCQRCARAEAECILGTSHRGGRRDRRQLKASAPTSDKPNYLTPHEAGHSQHGMENTAPSPFPSTTTGRNSHAEEAQDTGASTIKDTFASTSLHNTSDALNFLSHIASNSVDAQPWVIPQDVSGAAPAAPSNLETDPINVLQYHLVTIGALTSTQIAELLQRYATIYHPYYPIAPVKSLKPQHLNETARHEPHLLTAMITIAARDLPGGDGLLRVTSSYMDELVLQIFAGQRCQVEAVEALLLLAEWEPYSSSLSLRSFGCGDEDNAAWMHIGAAIRLGNLLRLDRGHLKEGTAEQIKSSNRDHLAWTACYLSDRQISVRLGRAFEARVGIPDTTHWSLNIPSLLPQTSLDDNHARVIQARIELTQIFNGVHNMLYLGMGGTTKVALLRDYHKHMTNFRTSINGWKRVWGTLTCSPRIKVLLQLSYEYLRLYTSAFIFQVTSLRNISGGIGERVPEDVGRPNLADEPVSLLDTQFIDESIDAAKTLLTIVNNYIPQDTSLGHFPIRFPLYCVNSAVFLYKAWSLALLSGLERESVRRLISDTIERLRRDSVRPTDLGPRYARLLELLWQQTDDCRQTSTQTTVPSAQGPQHFALQPDAGSRPLGLDQEEFSWLDLQTVGELLSEFSMPESEMRVDRSMQASRRGSGSWNDIGWLTDNESRLLF